MAETPALDQLTCDAFTGHVGDRFELRTGQGETREVTLVDAQTVGAAPEGEGRHPFCLLFASDDPEPLAQQTHTVTHQQMGTLELFLVPVGPGQDEAMRYEAVFT